MTSKKMLLLLLWIAEKWDVSLLLSELEWLRLVFIAFYNAKLVCFNQPAVPVIFFLRVNIDSDVLHCVFNLQLRLLVLSH